MAVKVAYNCNLLDFTATAETTAESATALDAAKAHIEANHSHIVALSLVWV